MKKIMMNNDCKQLSNEEVEVKSSYEYAHLSAQKNSLTPNLSALQPEKSTCAEHTGQTRVCAQ